MTKSKKIEYNEKNINILARAVMNSWDMKTLKIFAIDKLKEVYEGDKEAFEYDLKQEEI